MKKILIVTSEPENYVPVELEKAGKLHDAEVTIALTENFSYSFLEGGEIDVTYSDPEKDIKFNVTDFDFCIPRLNDDNLASKESLLHAIEDKGVKMINTALGMATCQEKILTERAMNTAKIKTPKTKVVLGALQIFEDDFKYPVIVKTNTGSQGIGVMKVDSFASLKSVAQLLCEKQMPFLIQEYLEHKFSYRIIMLGDELLASNQRSVPESDFRSNSHQNGKLVKNTEKYNPEANELEIAKQIVAVLGCQFCAIDYLLSDDDDRVMTVLEVNGSPGLEAIQEDHPDVNLAEAVILYCTKLLGDTSNAEPGKAPEKEDEKEVEDEEEEKAEDASGDTKEFVGETEHIVVKRFNDNNPIEAKVDTGADSCSIHGENIKISEDDKTVKFEFKDVIYRVPVERIVLIVKADHEKIRRAVIKMDVVLNDKEYKGVDMTVADRGELEYDFLIGKNLLADSDMPVKIEKSEEE
jgi:ribosomal protein S6--L-glutamate ligase